MQFTWDHIHYLEVRPYQNVKSIRQAVFKLPHSQEISCIGYNVNLQTAVAAILVFVECPKSMASEVLVVLMSYQNVKSIPQAVFKISRSQAIVDGRTDGLTDGQTDGRTGPFYNTGRIFDGRIKTNIKPVNTQYN